MSVLQRKQREREARRQALLAAAAKIFGAYGLENATIEMIAEAAEVAVGTVYLYFCSRDHLYLSLIGERLEHLRSRYLEVHARKLAPLDELRAMTAAYLDYLGESRGLFMTQLSVADSNLGKRLRRKAEIKAFRYVMALCRELFGLWKNSVARACAAGLLPGHTDHTRAAVVLWANFNGAFLLTADPELFHEVTGLRADGLCEQILDFQLARAERGSGARNNRSRRAVNNGAGLKLHRRKDRHNLPEPSVA